MALAVFSCAEDREQRSIATIFVTSNNKYQGFSAPVWSCIWSQSVCNKIYVSMPPENHGDIQSLSAHFSFHDMHEQNTEPFKIILYYFCMKEEQHT